MWHNGRRVIVDQWSPAREQSAALTAELDLLRRELDEALQRATAAEHERDEHLAQLRELQAVTLERLRAHYTLRTLQRERDIIKARNAERNPNAVLN
jgi:hypothetical protein